MTAPALIPTEDFFRLPDRTGFTISPDGTRIAFLAPWRNRLNVWIQDLEGDSPPRCVTADESRTVSRYQWTDDPRWLLYQQDDRGDENWHLYRIDLEDPSAPTVDLTPFPHATVQGLELRPESPGRALLQLNERDPAEFDLYELDIASGELRVLAQSPDPGATHVVAGEAVLTQRQHADGTWELWHGDHRIAGFDGDAYPIGVHPFEATPDGTGIWFGSYRDTDHMHLARLDLETGTETEIDRHPTCDLDTRGQIFSGVPSPLIRDRRTGELLGVRYQGMRMDIHALEPRFREVLDEMRALCDGDIGAISSDAENRRWIVSFLHDRDPQTWLYDHRTRTGRRLARTAGHLDPELLAPVQETEIPARDGRLLPAYFTLPHGAVADSPPPMVLMPHGGPWTRDWWGFDATVQLWANRGYAVLQPQFRGSAGFGRDHMEAAVGEFAGRMHDDLLDAVAWAVAHGHADPERVGVFGGSYGGYAALVGVAFTPNVFAAAVEYVGVTDLADFIRSVPEYARTGLTNNWLRYVGDPSDPEQEADMLARSPISRLDDIHAPLMVVQGAHDVRARRTHSDTIVEGLRGRGVDVDYLVFDDEGHFIVNPENLLAMFRAAERFFATHLGGRVAD